MEFLKLNDLELNTAGYLVSKKSGKPVTHSEFIKQQKNAEYIVKLAEAIKDKNFKPGKIDNLEDIKHEVLTSLNTTTQVYLKEPTKPVSKVNEELVKYALDFVNYEKSKEKTEKINELMNEFNCINDVESVGEYFTEGVIKLNNIYNIKTILAAVQITSDKLD